MENLAPGIRRFGKCLRLLSRTSIEHMTLSQIERAQCELRKNALTRLIVGTPHPQVHSEDRTIPCEGGPIPIRLYAPLRAAIAPRPLILAFHGGGWVFGNLGTADWICSQVAYRADMIVLSTGYRLAPQHRFPAGLDDCWHALLWGAENAVAIGATAGRIGVMGESAGGNLAAAICLLARERSGPRIDHQALIYPVVDLAAETESHRRNADGIIITLSDLRAFRAHYLGVHGDPLDWRASPLRAPSHAGLPPALVQVAAHDPLHDEGVAYARALQRAGVPVKLIEYSAMPHGFVNFPRFSRDAVPAIAEVAQEQRRFLSAPRLEEGS
jgi:acetyl esterase